MTNLKSDHFSDCINYFNGSFNKYLSVTVNRVEWIIRDPEGLEYNYANYDSCVENIVRCLHIHFSRFKRHNQIFFNLLVNHVDTS